MRKVVVPAAALLAVAFQPEPVSAGTRGTVQLGSAHEVLAFAELAERQGNVRVAETALTALTADPSAEVRAEARFRLAKLLAASGKTTEAAVLLRRVVDDQPTAAPARLELASLLYRLGDEKAALRELRALSTLNLPLNVARFVDRMSASLQASRPFAFQLELALAPDTNINRATRSDTLDTVLGKFAFDQDSKAKSGVGAAVRSLVQGRMNLSRNVNLAAHASLDAKLYRHREFNDVALEFAGGPEFQIGPIRLSTEAGAGQQWYGMKPYQRTLRLSSSAWLKVDDVSQLRVDGSARWSDNRFNDLQDGRGLGLAARYERALSPRLAVSVGASLDRFKASDDAYSTRSWTIGATAYREIGRMTVEIGGEIGRLKADDRLQILPEARQDKVSRLHVGTVFRQLTVAGFSPTLRLVVERNTSTVEFYDYKRTRTEFGISRAF